MTISCFISNLLAMFSCSASVSKALPREYRLTAEKLFPPAGFPEGSGPSLDAAVSFASVLGIAEDYKKLWEARASCKAIEAFLDHFQNNLDLLIQKTWVEKADEARKEDLQDKVEPFIELIGKGNYHDALEEFGGILEELAYLFFGAQSQKDDFSEYVVRIDPRMGLFWWYCGRLNREHSWIKNADRDVLYAFLLLGICYLTDF